MAEAANRPAGIASSGGVRRLARSLGPTSAVTVTFNPPLADGRLERQIRELAEQGIDHILVDNGSRNLEAIQTIAARYDRPELRVEVLALSQNLGIARALNLGVDRARSTRAPGWILTLDQDTCFAPDAFGTAADELRYVVKPGQAGVLAFNYYERLFGDQHPYNRSDRPSEERSIITSGNLVNVRVFDSIRFDDDFFLYFVDVEFCHRLRASGFSIWVFRNAFIDHQEGNEMVRGRRQSTYLDPPRLFFVARNGLTVSRRHASLKALAVVIYLVLRNCFNGVQPRRSVGFAIRGTLASVYPARFPPPRMG